MFDYKRQRAGLIKPLNTDKMRALINLCAQTRTKSRFYRKPIKIMSQLRYPVTVQGAQRLREELHKLKTIDRPAVIAAIAEARAHGDLSENADYDAAKDRQGFIEGRILELEGKISRLQIIDPSTLNANGRVVFGAMVVLENVAKGDEVRYQIVGEDEASVREAKISVTSPIARALMGKFVGDEVSVETPAGVCAYEIIDVIYEI